MTRKSIAIAAGLACVAALAGCRIHVDKDANGKEKTVQVDTPFGGVHVNTDQTSASDLGLPVYPGAKLETGDDNKSADIHMGFGEWQLRIRAIKYVTTDPQDKVAEFYKKALGRYGNVITCQGNEPVGTPTTTTEGLTCQDDNKNSKIQVNDHNTIDFRNGLQLKAGSKRHQHIVGFDQKGDAVHIALVALDLPASVDDGKSD